MIQRERSKVFEYTNDSWNLYAKAIQGKVSNGWLGWAVSLSGNGKVLAVGGPKINNNRGQAQIYEIDYAHPTPTPTATQTPSPDLQPPPQVIDFAGSTVLPTNSLTTKLIQQLNGLLLLKIL